MSSNGVQYQTHCILTNYKNPPNCHLDEAMKDRLQDVCNIDFELVVDMDLQYIELWTTYHFCKNAGSWCAGTVRMHSKWQNRWEYSTTPIPRPLFP